LNRTLMLAFWRERFTSIIRIGLLITVCGFPLIGRFFVKPVTVIGPADIIAAMMVLGAGVIGRDISTGVLQLILARPVTRREYVLSRWLALGCAGFAVGFLCWLILLPLALSSGGSTINHALLRLGEIGLASFGFAAVITGLSSLLPGFGDLALLLAGVMVGSFLSFLGDVGKSPAVSRIGEEVARTLVPMVSFGDVLYDGTFHAYPILAWASATTLGLLLAIYAMNRREFSYGSAG